jgi:lipopolysaccharide/colanic/teichoic acid biosynthesis glycosyltransferase
MKRLVDLLVASTGLILLAPFLIVVLVVIWSSEFCSPFYFSSRVGKDGNLFNMVKFRSMFVNADKSGVSSTSINDPRITPVGHFIRKYKIDEVTQLWNVLVGEMSLVGPRPQVLSNVKLYTDAEKRLLKVSPGITDFASIVFSDEGEILKNSQNPDLDYNKLIRPWKSRLGLVYVDNKNPLIDTRLIVLTVISVFFRKQALKGVQKILNELNAEESIVRISTRQDKLLPTTLPE